MDSKGLLEVAGLAVALLISLKALSKDGGIAPIRDILGPSRLPRAHEVDNTPIVAPRTYRDYSQWTPSRGGGL